VIDWKHGDPVARTLAWEGGAGVSRQVGTVGSASGESFGGSCAIASAPIALATWPAAWRGRLWCADFADGWIRAATVEGGVVTRIDLFDRRQGGIVAGLAAIAIEENEVTDAYRKEFRCVSAVVQGSRWQTECNAQDLQSFKTYQAEATFPRIH
jgi:hypothetical protein